MVALRSAVNSVNEMCFHNQNRKVTLIGATSRAGDAANAILTPWTTTSAASSPV